MSLRMPSALAVLIVVVGSLAVGQVTGATGAAGDNGAYVLGPGDKIDIIVVGERELSETVPIKPDGTVDLPLVGGVTAAGKTTSQLTAELIRRYSKYLKAPSITVAVAAVRVDHIYVLGQVNRPGEYNLVEGARASDLLAAAGGLTPLAVPQRAFIVRGHQQIPVNIQGVLAGDLEANIPLRPRDMMVVPQNQAQIVVMGAVNRPGKYDFLDGMKLIDAVAQAGGQMTTGNLDQVAIVRLEDGKTKTTVVHLDRALSGKDMSQNASLQPGDVVYVPEKGITLEKASYLFSILGVVRFLFGVP